jgi:hypothetical protein
VDVGIHTTRQYQKICRIDNFACAWPLLAYTDHASSTDGYISSSSALRSDDRATRNEKINFDHAALLLLIARSGALGTLAFYIL